MRRCVRCDGDRRTREEQCQPLSSLAGGWGLAKPPASGRRDTGERDSMIP